MVPYYFDIPELELPFDVDEKPYVQHPADYMSPTGLGLGGNSFQYKVVPENWYEDVKPYRRSTVFSLFYLLKFNWVSRKIIAIYRSILRRS